MWDLFDDASTPDAAEDATDGALWGLFGERDDTSWHHKALCAQTDPEAFFPEKGGSAAVAKSICAQCEVREQCLKWALEQDERFGIWGGMSERERRRYKKNQA